MYVQCKVSKKDKYPYSEQYNYGGAPKAVLHVGLLINLNLFNYI